jgi:hypothetical protein
MVLENAHKLSGFVNLVAGSAHLQDGQRLDKRIGSISPGRDHDLFSRLVNNTSLPRGTSTNRPGHQKHPGPWLVKLRPFLKAHAPPLLNDSECFYP